MLGLMAKTIEEHECTIYIYIPISYTVFTNPYLSIGIKIGNFINKWEHQIFITELEGKLIKE